MKIPEKVTIVEVGPRDGLQNINKWIPTKKKIELIETLIDSGFPKVEITSFVHPDAIPQMKDANVIAKNITMRCGSSFISNALVPNLYGAKAAWAQGIKEVTFVISASEEHNKANVNCSISDSLKELEKIRYEIPNLNIKLDIATAFGCPYVGEVAFSNISKIVDEVAGLGIHEICLCDTIGCANPMQVKNILKPLLSQYNHRRFSVHFHDTRGMGLVNSFTALQYGIMSFESSVGGMGGCPFAPGASGNVATEDLVNMFESMGVKTGIDYMKLTKAVKIVEDLGVDLTSHMALVDGEKTT